MSISPSLQESKSTRTQPSSTWRIFGRCRRRSHHGREELGQADEEGECAGGQTAGRAEAFKATAATYDDRDLEGLKVSHAGENLNGEEDRILTLKDSRTADNEEAIFNTSTRLKKERPRETRAQDETSER